MWSSVLAVNSFFVWPISFIFLVYSIGRMALFLEWKLFVIAAIIFACSTILSMIIGVIVD